MPTSPDADDEWTAERRSALVLRLLRGETTVEQAARDHELPAARIAEWERRFLAAAVRGLGTDRNPAATFRSTSVRLAILALALLWLGLRVAYWNGYYIEDAPGYVTDAAYFAVGDTHARDYVTGLNIGTYLPVAVPLRLLGKTELALGLWPMFCSLLGAAALAGTAGVLFGRGSGLLAALLYVTYPGDVFFSTVVMPDAIQAAWLSVSMFLVVYACDGRLKASALAAAGATMGFCHLVRANGPLLLPVGLFSVVVFSRRWRRDCRALTVRALTAYMGGWVLIQLLEGLFYLWSAGDFFHRFEVVNRHYGTVQSLVQWGLNTDLRTIPFSIFPPLLWSNVGGWGQLNQDQAYHGLIFFLALLAIPLGRLCARYSRVPIPARSAAGFIVGVWWFAWPLAYHEFGSQSLTHFVPIHRLSRHLVVYAPGAVFALVAGCFLAWNTAATLRSPALRRTIAGAGVAVLLVHLQFNWQGADVSFAAFHRIKDTYARIRDRLPADVRRIAGDPGDLCFFDFWLNPLGAQRVRIIPFASVSSCDELSDGVVLTQSNPGWKGLAAPIIRETVTRLPCLVNPPDTWRLLYDGHPERVFVVGAMP